MNKYESNLADLLDELEDHAWNRDKGCKINQTRNKIMALAEKMQKPQWNRLDVIEPTEEEKKDMCTCMTEPYQI